MTPFEYGLRRALLSACLAIACGGTETGNPGPRGCGDVCGACGTPIVLEIPSSPRTPPDLDSIVVDAREIACTRDEDGVVRCALPEEPYARPDTYQLTIEIMGLDPIQLQVELRASAGCCACEYEAVTVRMQL